MTDRLFRLRLSDGTTWAVVAETAAGARTKADVYFPYSHVQIEESINGEPWRLVDAGCERCLPNDVMKDLGTACDVSCGTDRYPTEAE